MTNNLLVNGSFEADWAADRSHRCLVFPGGEERTVGNVFTPSGGWVTWFRHEPGTWDQPEVRDAWKENDPARVYDGQKGMLLFTFFRNHDGGFMQQVQVEPGTRLGLSAYAHAWSNGYDGGPHNNDPRWSEGVGRKIVAILEGEAPPVDPLHPDAQRDGIGNFTFWVGIDPTGGIDPYSDAVVWGQGFHIYNGFGNLTAEAVAEAGTVTVFLRSRTMWEYRHNDAYWDGCILTIIPNGDIPLDEGRGQPRMQYSRRYVLLPQDVTLALALAAMEGAYPKRMTVGFSADDAGIGNLDSRQVVAVNEEEWK